MRKPPLYGDLISSALLSHSRLPVRAEQVDGYDPAMYVDESTADLFSPDWQIVYGRRGAGKTSLLHDYVHQIDAPNRKHAVFYISAQALEVSLDASSATAKALALLAFQALIEQLGGFISGILTDLRSSGPGKQKRGELDRADELTIELLELGQMGERFVGSPNGVKTTYSTSTRGIQRASVSASVRGLGAAVSRTAGSETQMGSEQTFTAERAAWYGNIRPRLQQLMPLLGLRRLDIAIDEWSSLDPSGDSEVQVHFAEYLKRAFLGVPGISLKVASIRSRGRFSRPREDGAGVRGLEVGGDIFEAVDLDRFRLSEDRLREFFVRLLFRRLLKVQPSLNVFAVESSGVPDDQFVASIFQNERAFRELIAGAEGVPRDFVELFSKVSRHYEHGVEPAWDVGTIRQVIMAVAADRVEALRTTSSGYLLLSGPIRRVIEAANSKYFLVRKSDRRVAPALEQLYDARIVHDVAHERLRPDYRTDFRPFVVDYGVYLDWTKGGHGRLRLFDHRRHEGVIPIEGDPSPFVVTGGDDPRRLVCDDCGRLFDPEASAYQKKRLCPHCFEPQHEDGLKRNPTKG